jgi:hypothetical protein
MREEPPLKVFSQLSHLNVLQWPLLTSTGAVTLPQTSEFGVLNPPSVAASGMALISANSLPWTAGEVELWFLCARSNWEIFGVYASETPAPAACGPVVSERGGGGAGRGGGEAWRRAPRCRACTFYWLFFLHAERAGSQNENHVDFR